MTIIPLLSLKVVKESASKYDLQRKINSPGDAFKVFEEVFEMTSRPEEILAMLTLNTKNHITGAFIVCQGSLNSSIVHPREVYKRALMQNASSIIIAHNHPSTDTTPSPEDISTTKRLVEAGKIMGIELLDHLIIGEGYESMKQRGVL